jgi:hypothetical protein
MQTFQTLFGVVDNPTTPDMKQLFRIVSGEMPII